MEKKEFKIGLGTTIMLFLLIAIIIVAFTVYMIKVNKDEKIGFKEPITNTNLEQTEGVSVVPTMQDKISADSSWCCTFQLVWNDMKNEIVGQDVVFTPQEEMAEKIECSTRYISDIEQDRSKPSYEVLIRICNNFNIGMNEIFSEYLKITGNREENLSLVGFNKLSEKNKETIIHLIEYFNK